MPDFTLAKAFIELATKGDVEKELDRTEKNVEQLNKTLSLPTADIEKLASKLAGVRAEEEKLKETLKERIDKVFPKAPEIRADLLDKELAKVRDKSKDIREVISRTDFAKAAKDFQAAVKEQDKLDRKLRDSLGIGKPSFGQRLGAGLAAAGAVGATADAFFMSSVGKAAPVQMELFQRSIDDLQAVIGHSLIPYMESLTEKVRAVADWLFNLDPAQQRLIAGTVALGSALATIIPIAAGTAAALKYVMGSSLAGIGAVALPITLVVAAAGGLAYTLERMNRTMTSETIPNLERFGFHVSDQRRSEIAQKEEKEFDARKKMSEEHAAFLKSLDETTYSKLIQSQTLMGQAPEGSNLRKRLQETIDEIFKKAPYPNFGKTGQVNAEEEAKLKSSVGLAATGQTAIMAAEDFINRVQLEALKVVGPDKVEKAVRRSNELLERIATAVGATIPDALDDVNWGLA